MNSRFLFVLLLGFAFTFIFTAFQTMSIIEETLLQSISADNPHFTGSGYLSLAIVYAVFSVSNWLAPSFIALIGAKWTMVIGACTYLHFIASFLQPSSTWLYASSALNGFGGALLWTGQGHYLTVMSTENNIARNSAIFWSQFQLSLLVGSIFVYTQFSGTDRVPSETRHLVVLVLTIVCAVGVSLFLLLKRCPPNETSALPSVAESNTSSSSSGDEFKDGATVPPASVCKIAAEAFQQAIHLFCTKNMLLLSLTFFYTGLELSFFSGIYSTCIGNTNTLPDQKKLVGLSGLLIGTGEILAGGVLTVIGFRASGRGSDKTRSITVLLGGLVSHVTAFLLAFLVLPSASSESATWQRGYVSLGGREMALVCSFLLGAGDACFNTQIYSLLAHAYKNQPSAAFAIYKFVQSLAAAVSFFYSTVLLLHWQLLLLVIFAAVGACCFSAVDLSLSPSHSVSDSLQQEETTPLDNAGVAMVTNSDDVRTSTS